MKKENRIPLNINTESINDRIERYKQEALKYQKAHEKFVKLHKEETAKLAKLKEGASRK